MADQVFAQSPNQQSSSYLSKSMQPRLAVIYDAWRSLCLPLSLQMREACLCLQFAAALPYTCVSMMNGSMCSMQFSCCQAKHARQVQPHVAIVPLLGGSLYSGLFQIQSGRLIVTGGCRTGTSHTAVRAQFLHLPALFHSAFSMRRLSKTGL